MRQLILPGFAIETKYKRWLIYVISALLMISALFYPVKPQHPTESMVLGQSSEKILPVVPRFLPVLKENAQKFELPAFSGMAIDVRSGKVLFEKNPAERWPTASLAKLMTALVAVNLMPISEVVEVAEADTEASQPVMGLVSGEKITVGDLLKGMLISSSNDAAMALSRTITGSGKRFVELMNLMSSQLQLKNTNFQNPAGFDDEKQFTTAEDLVKLASDFLRIPLFAQIVKTRQEQVSSVNGNLRHWLKNSNKLLFERDDVFGVKTGSTEKAKGNLIAIASDKSGHEILTVVLGSDNRETDSTALIDWIFRSYDF